MAAGLRELEGFVAIATKRSFAAAAAQMNVSRSTLSHSIRRLEERAGVRLLNRTTRSVAPTDAGRELLERIAPALEIIEEAFAGAAEKAEPSGPLRITAPHVAGQILLASRLNSFCRRFPDVRLEINLSDELLDIVEQGFDAGIRLNETVARDMIGVRLTPPFSYATVASPGYIRKRGMPQHPSELVEHSTIGYRFPTRGTLYRWEYERRSEQLLHSPSGAPILNDVEMTMQAALDGIGIAYVARPLVEAHLRTGALREMLAPWSVESAGLFLYYPGRRHTRLALRAFSEHFRLSEWQEIAD